MSNQSKVPGIILAACNPSRANGSAKAAIVMTFPLGSDANGFGCKRRREANHKASGRLYTKIPLHNPDCREIVAGRYSFNGRRNNTSSLKSA